MPIAHPTYRVEPSNIKVCNGTLQKELSVSPVKKKLTLSGSGKNFIYSQNRDICRVH